MSATVEPNPKFARVEQIETWICSLCAPFQSRIGYDDQRLVAARDRFASKAKRKLEFAHGRRLAESLLKSFGNSQQVWTNQDRSPAWPEGFCGSISHSDYWTWAVVGRQQNTQSIGIDTEPIVSKKTRDQILFEVATNDEWRQFEETDLTPEQLFTVAFSAKEAFYKCCSPIVKTYFGFEHATIRSVTKNSLRIWTSEFHPQRDRMPESLEVHYLVTDQDVFTLTWMEPN